MMFSSVPDVVNFEPGDYVDANDDLDPAIIKAIMDKINENNLRLMEGFAENADKAREFQRKLMEEIAELFAYLDNKLYTLKPSYDPYDPYGGSGETKKHGIKGRALENGPELDNSFDEE